jgi:hypothetical protein
LLKLALLVLWLTLLGGAIHRRVTRAPWARDKVDPLLTHALWVLAYSCAAYITAAALIFANMYLGGPRWLDSMLLALLLSSAVVIALAASVCGLRAAREQRHLDRDQDGMKRGDRP